MKSMFDIPRCRAACSQRFHLAWYKQFVGGELDGCQVVPWLSFPRVIFFIVKFDTNELKSTYFGCMKRDLSVGFDIYTSVLGYRYFKKRSR